MGILYELQEEMRGLEEGASHNGYWYKIGETLTIMVCGLLCGLQKMDEWSIKWRSLPKTSLL